MASHIISGVKEANGTINKSINPSTVDSRYYDTDGIRKMHQYNLKPEYRYNQFEFLLFWNVWDTDLVS